MRGTQFLCRMLSLSNRYFIKVESWLQGRHHMCFMLNGVVTAKMNAVKSTTLFLDQLLFGKIVLIYELSNLYLHIIPVV